MKYSIKNNSLDNLKSMLNLQIKNTICTTISVEYINKFSGVCEVRSFRKESDNTKFCLVEYTSKKPIIHNFNPYMLTLSEFKTHIFDMIENLNCKYLIFE